MNLVGAFILLGVFVLLYTLIIEVFTILFRLTGLTPEKARTQVISMLTNSGFTTAESEVVLSARRRRTLAQVTMLFGYSFTVIIVSSIVNVFLSLSVAQMDHLLPSVLVAALFLLLFFLVLRLPPLRSRLDHLIERVGNRVMFGRDSNPVMLVDLYGDKAVAEVCLEHVPAFLHQVPLARSGLRDGLDIHVMLLRRDGCGELKIDGDTTLEQGDTALMFGSYKNIRRVFEHPE